MNTDEAFVASGRLSVPVLIYLVRPDPEDSSRLGAIVQQSLMASEWRTAKPDVVDDLAPADESKGDQPVRTVGLVLWVGCASGGKAPQLPKEQDAAELADVERLVKIACDYSMTFNKKWMLSYDGCDVGVIDQGEPDSSIVRGLLDPWHKGTA